ncbi:hypothetical protein RQM65_07160 [Pricia sp. S334]|uniref:Transposase n=1 Tax=Pricia mediterranea TaxID=3076079 RepID=A0ABU3L517_9FLAO|nr:hypothetical protein [Pricia sp. S334]MDT7828436.1 hypothetical protein [Pricia sp. S334]
MFHTKSSSGTICVSMALFRIDEMESGKSFLANVIKTYNVIPRFVVKT